MAVLIGKDSDLESSFKTLEGLETYILSLISQVISAYHTTRLSDTPVNSHILSKPMVQAAAVALVSAARTQSSLSRGLSAVPPDWRLAGLSERSEDGKWWCRLASRTPPDVVYAEAFAESPEAAVQAAVSAAVSYDFAE